MLAQSNRSWPSSTYSKCNLPKVCGCLNLAPMKTMTETLAQQLGKHLQARALKVTTVESCTGGGIAAAITDVAGSSHWFDMGFVTYSNQAKQAMVGVSDFSLSKHGAVSDAVVREMAQGALARSGANVAVAVSGVAGPAGGTKDKPVGTVWFAWAADFREEMVVQCSRFNGGRAEVRHQAIMAALRGLIEIVK